MKKQPVNDQLHLLFDKDEGQTPNNHFIFSITYECVNKWHDQCKGSKCYCLCHYRCNRAGNYVKITKAQAKAEAEQREQKAWEATLSAGGLLPGESEMSNVPLFESGKPKGYICSACKKYHEFDAYVVAHWTTRLIHDCDNCRARHALLGGVATKIKDAVKGWVPF